MEVLKSREFWINGILGFLLIVFIDWSGGRDWKLFQGFSFSQVTEGYRVKIAWLIIGFAVSDWSIYKKQKKS